MRIIPVALCLVVAALPACERATDSKVEPPSVGEAMPQLPIPPQGRIVGRSGSMDALQLTLTTNLPPDQTASFYRGILLTPEWRLISDTRDSAGAYIFYAEGKRPLWVHILPDSAGSRVKLTGAVPGADTAYARRRQDAADTTNTLRPR